MAWLTAYHGRVFSKDGFILMDCQISRMHGQLSDDNDNDFIIINSQDNSQATSHILSKLREGANTKLLECFDVQLERCKYQINLLEDI
jgi:hypothetical protein